MIVTDLDGTLYRDIDKFDTERFYRVFEKLKKRGIIFAIATGNQHHLVNDRFNQIADEIVMISENGSYILKGKEELYSTHLEDEALYTLCEKLNRFKVTYLICGKKKAYVLKRNGKDHFEDPKHFPKIEMIDDYHHIDDHILKISFNDHNFEAEDIMQKVNEVIDNDKEIIATGFSAYDIIEKDINKLFAVKLLANKYQVKPEEIMAFGDGANDIGMLRYVGHPYIMANAKEEYRKMFNHVAKNCEDNGVLEILEDFVGIK